MGAMTVELTFMDEREPGGKPALRPLAPPVMSPAPNL